MNALIFISRFPIPVASYQCNSTRPRDRSNRLLCSVNLDEFALRGRRRDGFACFAQCLNVEFNSLANEFQYFSARLADRNTARKIWNVGTIACLAFFNHHEVFHLMLLRSLETSLLQDTIERAN